MRVNINERIGVREGGIAISERAEESSRNSTPPGTIGDIHDIRSEQPVHANAALTRFGQRGARLANFEGQDSDGDSVKAAKSIITKVTAVANVSAPIPLSEHGSHIKAFRMGYLQLFDEFKGKLVD